MVYVAGLRAATALGGRELTYRHGLSAAAGLTGGVGVLVLPTLLQVHAGRSRKHLRRQGLSIRRVPPGLAALGSITAATTLLVYAIDSEQILIDAEDAGPTGVTGITAYAFALGAGTLQLELNRRARSRADWLGMAPDLAPGRVGLRVGARW